MPHSYLDFVHTFKDSLTFLEELALYQATFVFPYSFMKDLKLDSWVNFDISAFLVELEVNLHYILAHTTKADLPLEDSIEDFVVM
jgi:hypothetical protein